MLAQIITENGQKKIIPLTADAGAGNPVGTIIPMYKKSSPSGYLYCDGSTFDQTKYPLLYAYLGSNVLPDYDTSRQSGEPYSYIKATSGLSENAQDNVINTLNEERSYSTEEVNTGKKWIDGKPIYRKVVDFGALPNASEKTVNHNISNIATVTKIAGHTTNGISFYPLPYLNTDSAVSSIMVYMTTTIIAVRTGSDRTAFTNTKFTVEYTKTTD